MSATATGSLVSGLVAALVVALVAGTTAMGMEIGVVGTVLLEGGKRVAWQESGVIRGDQR
jgi:hypothetical protein